jgi:metallo-beta-lactamase class B
MRRILFLLAAIVICLPLRAEVSAEWTTPVAPFRIADNLYYVGSRDLAAYLVVTPKGNILINANLVASPPQIRASVEKLGYRWSDTKILLNGQAHFDHLAGAAQVVRETHAKDIVMEYDADVARSGGHKDFAFGKDITTDYPKVRVDRVLHDGDTVTLGGVTLIAHRTAGHTRGCTTWTMDTHVPGEPAGKVRHVVIIGGMAALPGYQLVAAPGHPESYPGIAADFEQTFSTLKALPCDIFLGAHGVYFNMLAKMDRMRTEGPEVFVDPAGYKAAIASAQASFEKMLAGQKAVSTR